MFKLGRDGQLALLPRWFRTRIEVNRYYTYRLLERAQRETASGARLLDAGSGEGQFQPYFTHTNYTGVDLAVGDKTWDYTGIDVQADLRQTPFKAASFDTAVCIQTMEHVNEPNEVIREISRVLKPGGRFYVSAPQSWHQHQKPYDFFRYTSFGFRHLLEKNGLKVVEMQPWGGYFWFLSFNLQLLHVILLPKPRNKWLRLIQLPFELLIQFFFFLVFPILFFYLDRLDKQKDYTLGWSVVAEKMNASKEVRSEK